MNWLAKGGGARLGGIGGAATWSYPSLATDWPPKTDWPSEAFGHLHPHSPHRAIEAFGRGGLPTPTDWPKGLPDWPHTGLKEPLATYSPHWPHP